MNKDLYVGQSDVACLTLVGVNICGITAEILHMGVNGSYNAHYTDDVDSIPQHYTLVKKFRKWLSVFDDEGLKAKVKGEQILVFRAGQRSIYIYAGKEVL